MRHTSERVPGKNYRNLGGVPLYHHVIRTLLDVPEIDEVVIDTDSDVILEDATSTFPTVRVLLRPPHLRDGAIPMNDVLLNSIDQLGSDTILQTHSTNPFVRAATFSSALTQFLAPTSAFDSVFGVTRIQARLWSHATQPINHDPTVLLRTQDLDPVYLENSCLYVFTPDLLRSRKNRIGARPLMLEIPPEEALDIDDEHDFRLADAVASTWVL